MDVGQLLHALNNEANDAIIELDYAQIAKAKNDILQQLHLPKDELKALHTKLKLYRHVLDMDHIRYGSYIRWISLKNPPPLKLTNGGIICNIKLVKDDIHISCKNRMNRIFQINMAEVVVFQKLNEQEQVILKALKYLE
jgi:hypothetical protein